MSPAPDLVVDTSVAVKWFFDEPHSMDALRVLEACRAGAYRPVAPDLIYPEFGNAVWKRVSNGGLDAEDGATIIAAFNELPLASVPGVTTLRPAYEVAVGHGRTVYDATFVALSLLLDAQLVTADRHLYRAVQPHFPQVRWIGDWRGG